MSDFVYRIHPSIGIARMGNSEEYYIGPETMAGLPLPKNAQTANTDIKGGLPIKPDTDSDTITSSYIRDSSGKFKRQGSRFRIFQYPKEETETYPNGGGSEIQIGSTVNGKKVTDIIWTVHLANKKANCFILENPNISGYQLIIDGYKNGNLPPLRNQNLQAPLGDLTLQKEIDPNNARRLNRDGNNLQRLNLLTIDPGPRAIQGQNQQVKFDENTPASFWESGNKPTPLPNYPKSYPDGNWLGSSDNQKKFSQEIYYPTNSNSDTSENSKKIDTLGELRTDDKGRLVVLGGYGLAGAWYDEINAQYYPLDQYVDNDGWFDDMSDGPVSAVLVFEDGTTQEVDAGAWVVCTDPSYAPQTLNVVPLWEDMYNSWVREPELNLCPELFNVTNQTYNPDYWPSFDQQVSPFFTAAALQVWNTNLPKGAIYAHQAVGKIQGSDDPDKTILAGLAYIRNPNHPAQSSVGAPLMPFHLGDNGQAFLSPTFTQYFFLSQWSNKSYTTEEVPQLNQDGKKTPAAKPLGPGEYLDKAVLMNCLGGRFSPGIDLTFIVRQPELYIQDWSTSGTGPFRINAKKLDYTTAQPDRIFLSQGYIPARPNSAGIEPGDVSKFMALPWHTDYNSCATHTTVPNPQKSNTLYWSWPGQRPVAVYAAKDVKQKDADQPFPDASQRYSVRGEGTEPRDPAVQGRYQDSTNMVKKWHQIGVVMQGTAIDTEQGPYSANHYLEVESKLGEPDDSVVQPWPINATQSSDLDIP